MDYSWSYGNANLCFCFYYFLGGIRGKINPNLIPYEMFLYGQCQMLDSALIIRTNLLFSDIFSINSLTIVVA